MIVEALQAKGLPVAYVLYEGEQHGFRKAENIKRTLDGELYFYARVFGFELADEVERVAIENLEGLESALAHSQMTFEREIYIPHTLATKFSALGDSH